MDGVMKKAQKQLDANVRRSRRLNGNVGPSAALLAAKKNARVFAQKNPQKHDGYIRDIYQTAREAKTLIHKSTGLVYDYRMAEHRCLWDTNHQERPERFTRVIQRCTQLGLIQRCKEIQPREATIEEILMKHTQESIDILKATDNSESVIQLEETSSNYDAVYIHPTTYKLCLLAAGSTIKLIDEICLGNVQNGMAVIRPPGHHAMKSEYCGYCFFNNVAIAAEHALRHLNVSRILIVDWDAHHGQATQQMFYDDPRVVYFSIHRYEHGTFWPNLRESEFDYIGEGEGKGFNFNIPLNKIGMTDADYMAIFQQVLLPMATEFQPDLIIVSAGYDAAIGCPEGEMEVSPACYAHLLTSLMGLANSRVAVILEGGYCLQSLAEGAALTLRALLGDPCPNLPSLEPPCHSIQETILNCIFTHRDYWQCYQYQGVYNPAKKQPGSKRQHWPQVQYNHTPQIFVKYQTRGGCPVQSREKKQDIALRLSTLIKDTKLLSPEHKVCLVYDPLMMEHKNNSDPVHPEKPERISCVYNRHLEYGILDRLHLIKSREANTEELLLVHDQKHLDEINELCSPEDFSEEAVVRRQKAEKDLYNSIYIHPKSYTCASIAAGSILQVVDSVLSGTSGSGVAIVRPPGHHAEAYEPCGFCLFNSVSIAAKYAIKNFGLKRILLLDWDVHHGNGTQRIFESDPSVLYISIHRYDRGNFFPASLDAAATVIGSGPGIGFNVNIPWNQKGMGNTEYIAAFHQIVLPIAYQFNPELVLVSAGFDATIGDPLGGCKVAPEAYAHFTQWLSPLAMGRLILCLEGGYNLTSTSYAMTLCTKTLLGDPVPNLEMNTVRPGAVNDIKTVLEIQSKYWSSLCFNKDLPDRDVLGVEKSQWNNATDDMKLLQIDGLKQDVYRNTDVDFNEEFTKSLSLDKQQIDELEGEILEISMEDETKSLQLNTDFNIKIELLHEVSESERVCSDRPNKNDGDKRSSSQAGTSSSQATSSSASTSHLRPTLTNFLNENMDLLLKAQGFAVYPIRDCPHLPSVCPVPTSGIDINSPCVECTSTVENWICLTCYSVHCGRVINEHMLHHTLESTHPLVLGFADLSVWCYECDAYIDNPVLFEAKNAANLSKFGEPLPNIYG